jgi:hypothetical protein
MPEAAVQMISAKRRYRTYSDKIFVLAAKLIAARRFTLSSKLLLSYVKAFGASVDARSGICG